MLISERFAALRRRLADETGMTMAVVMGTMLIATLFSVAAIAATQNDLQPARKDVTIRSSSAGTSSISAVSSASHPALPSECPVLAARSSFSASAAALDAARLSNMPFNL